jgi:hypothetical protein
LLAENLTNAATGTRDRRRFGIIEIRYRTAGRVGRRSEVQRAVVGLRRVNLNITRPLDAQWSSRPEQQIQRAVFEHLAIRAASTVFAFHPANGGWRSAQP